MAANIEIKSFNQILGDMIRKIIAETPLNDVNTGSVLLTLLEACASQDFENNVAILNVLELLSVDALRNNDLDAKAAEYGLSRNAAIRSSGQITISNSAITKRSTGLYVVKPAPIAGQSVLYVNNTTGWSTGGGTLFIGRGTESFEGPISYTSITVYPTYSQINLSTSLQKDHLISDTVIDAQGQPDRLIAAGTTVKIPANNQNPEIRYNTLRDAVIPAGEDKVTGVSIIAQTPGSRGNAPINTITSFDVDPFAGATVTNTSALSDGKDVETDNELRNRIKAYTLTLARGTSPSILSAVIGISDSDDNKQVASAILTEPVKTGDPSILYIDDGSGFQPSYSGQSVDVLLKSANGTEEFLQLSNYPLPRPQVVNVAEGPFTLTSGMFLRVSVDADEETITFSNSDFVNISAATVSEIIIAINSRSSIFKARFTNNSSSILLYPVAFDAEVIQVSALKSTDDSVFYANSVLKFPTTESSYISLYQNSTRLREKSKSATLETIPYASWNITSSGNLILSVDGTPSQNRSIDLSDFSGAASFSSLTLNDWVQVFNKKFAGITASATPSQKMIIVSNKVGSESLLSADGGSYINKLFSGVATSDEGQTAQFELNRQTGNLRILTDIVAGDSITAGTEDAKGFAISSSTISGTYNVASDGVGRPAEMVMVADSSYCSAKTLSLTVGTVITVSAVGDVMRIMTNSLIAFADLKPGDYVYISRRTSGWLSAANCGLHKIVSKGEHTTVGANTYIEVLNSGAVAESVAIIDSSDIKAFETDGYPQIWRGIYVSNPAAEPISGVVASLNKDIVGVKASIFRSNSIKLTSITENGGSIAIPVSIGNASGLFSEVSTAQFGNQSHIANRVSDASMLSMFKRTSPTSNNVWLNRHTYSAVKGPVSTTTSPDVAPFSGTYSESIQSTGVLTSAIVQPDDLLVFTKGNNRNQIRSIKAILPSDTVGTQQSTPRTELDHIANEDEFLMMRSLDFASDDSVVVIMDNDAVAKTVDVKLSRSGKVNSGYVPNTTEFSADDIDNESGITFGSPTVWGTSINGTDFKDYSVLMRARNWYSTGGTSGGAGKMMVRAAQYGASGNKLRFNIIYPEVADSTATTVFKNTPSWSLLSYVFGSGPERAISLSSGNTISVAGPYPDASTNFPSGAPSSGNYYDLTFSAGTLAAVVVGDVLSIRAQSGVSLVNRGQFSVLAKSGNTVRVFNPSGSATTPGAPEITSVTAIADVLGTPSSLTWTVTSGAALDGTYLVFNDNQGTIKMWFDVDNNGTPEPVSPAYSRTLKISTILNTDTATVVAQKIRDYLVNDQAFTNVFNVGNQVLYTLAQNGPVASPVNGSPSPGFSYAISTLGTANITLDGKYFTIYDDVGSVAVWFDVGNNNTTEPFHGAQRSIKVTSINPGDSANTVAAAIAAAVNPDSKFNASALGAVITITNTLNGNVSDALAGTSGFSISVTQGTLGTAEIITNPSQIIIFPLLGTAVSDICDTINAKEIIKAVAIGTPSLTITKATKEDTYAYVSNATALGYGHNPTSPSLRDFISLYDGQAYVKSFQNANPHFTLKTTLTLNGVSAIYAMNTAPNEDTADVGEYFKLVPTTIQNVKHHLTQKALSQLPIVSNIDISNFFKNVQVRSKKLGSEGAVEIVGGRANSAASYIIGESEVNSDISGEYLTVKISAFPDTFNVGDVVRLDNDSGVKRLSRLISTDSIDVATSAPNAEYRYNAKNINVVAGSQFTITDVSASYSRPAGTVFRWTHGGGGVTFASVKAGDILHATGTLTGWAQGNKSMLSGDGKVSGFPIINVNDGANWIEVVNPRGSAMTATAVGAGSSIKICPTPIIRWHLDHAARVGVASIARTGGTTITVNTDSEHLMNTGNNVDLIDSDNIADGVYGPITVTSATQFTFASAGSNFSEVDVNASVINALSQPTRYRVEKIGINSLTKITRIDGDSPRFVDCGAAVDDYVVLGGSTFSNNNNGRYRILAVDNDSLMLMNESAVDELNTLVPFNNKSLTVAWTANNTIVTGVAGAFKNVSVGDWVKKEEDPDSYYRQVTSITPATPALATQITLGGVYLGSTASANGVSYDQNSDVYKGVVLKSIDDIVIYEGDSVVVGDTLQVQNNININWFDSKNSGSFEIKEIGTSADYRPFLRVTNSIAANESSRLMSVALDGFYLIESDKSKIYSYRQIDNIVLSDINEEQRVAYLTPSNRAYKFSEASATKMSSVGKLGYSTDVTIGIDGYLYYTGLLRKAQRVVDGFEPDPENYPGRRAVGGAIELLPPLIRKIVISLDITTNEGVNLGDISGSIKSTAIQYVQSLGVGEDVILSEIIAAVMQIKGVAAVTFTFPSPSTERVTIADNEKATLSPDDIGIS